MGGLRLCRVRVNLRDDTVDENARKRSSIISGLCGRAAEGAFLGGRLTAGFLCAVINGKKIF